jgi:hypothetical protein
MTSYLTGGPLLREARVRPGAANRCPWAPEATWLPASSLADEALKRESGVAYPERRARRILPDDVFEFRGGRPEAPVRRRARTRWGDHVYQGSRA